VEYARAMALRQRFILWQLQKALQKSPASKVTQPAPVTQPEYAE
jgi:hypothetical protein